MDFPILLLIYNPTEKVGIKKNIQHKMYWMFFLKYSSIISYSIVTSIVVTADTLLALSLQVMDKV